jgi:RNA polymerase sigma factor (sigma-70 family)
MHRHLDGYRGDAPFWPWLRRIAANHALMRLRRRRRKPETSLEIERPTFDADGAHTREIKDISPLADQIRQDAELGARIREAIQALPEAYRIVLVLADYEDRSMQEIASTLDLTVPNVKTRIHRARSPCAGPSYLSGRRLTAGSGGFAQNPGHSMGHWGTSHPARPTKLPVALGAGRRFGGVARPACVVLAFLGLEVRTPPLVGVDLVDDPVPQDVRVTRRRRSPKVPGPSRRAKRAGPGEPPPDPLPAGANRSPFCGPAAWPPPTTSTSAFLSDRDARAIREAARSPRSSVAPPRLSPGLLPSPKRGWGRRTPTRTHSRLFRDGERDRGEDRPPPGAPARTVGAPPSGALETRGASERTAAQEALDPLDAALGRELAGVTDDSTGDLPVGAGSDPQIAAASETREAREAREQNETDGTNAAPDRSGQGDALADADVLGEPQEIDAPEGGGADRPGKTGVESDWSPARDGAAGRHTLPGQLGAPSQLQAAPTDVPIHVGAMPSVRGNPLGPWLVQLDTALRERWKPPPDLRMTEATAIVSFTVSRQGRVTEIELEHGSGRSAVDALAMASIPARVPAPSGVAGDPLRIRYSFHTGP